MTDRLSRRGFLDLSLALPFAILPCRLTAAPSADFIPDIEFDLTAQPARSQILPGDPTSVWSYKGVLRKGRAGTLTESGTYLGPLVRVRRGDKVRVRFQNQLSEATIVHWHGVDLPESADGHPRLVIPPGEIYVYEFEVINRAGQYFYHPHPHERTGSEVYRGLAGLFIVEDDEERSLGLPFGDHEIPVVLQDRRFDSANQFLYLNNRMEAMTGFVGDRVLINGAASRSLSLGTGVYRLRFLNGSNSRIYKLAWSNGLPFTVIGTDGGLLERSVQKPYLTLGPAQRADTILDLTAQPQGSSLQLKSISFPAAAMQMMGGGMGRMIRTALPQGAEFDVLRVGVDKREHSRFELPPRLADAGFLNPRDAENAGRPHSFSLSFRRMQWFLNGSTFDMMRVKDNEIFRAGSLRMIEFRNEAMGMMGLIHPIHIHGRHFQVMGRFGTPFSSELAAALSEGIIDEGWRDTVLVLPGETVRLLVRFSDYKGLFLYHCHSLEHEDMGMMRNFRLT